MSRTKGHRIHRYAGHKLWLAEKTDRRDARHDKTEAPDPDADLNYNLIALLLEAS